VGHVSSLITSATSSRRRCANSPRLETISRNLHSICLGRAASLLAMCNLSTLSLNSASTFSASALSGRLKLYPKLHRPAQYGDIFGLFPPFQAYARQKERVRRLLAVILISSLLISGRSTLIRYSVLFSIISTTGAHNRFLRRLIGDVSYDLRHWRADVACPRILERVNAFIFSIFFAGRSIHTRPGTASFAGSAEHLSGRSKERVSKPCLGYHIHKSLTTNVIRIMGLRCA
jgi:hypothetical protein